MKNSLETAGKRYAVLAPTGCAAVQCGGTTIHRFLMPLPHGCAGRLGWLDSMGKLVTAVESRDGMRPEYDEDGNLRSTSGAEIKELDTIFVDEISMVDNGLLTLLDQRLRATLDQYDTPFGGLRIVVTGDFGQLPPVDKRSQGCTGQFAYHCWTQGRGTDDLTGKYYGSVNYDTWAQANFTYIVLTEQMRASTDTSFNAIAKALRSGRPFALWSEEEKALITNRCFNTLPPDRLDMTHAFWSNDAARTHNQARNEAVEAPVFTHTDPKYKTFDRWGAEITSDNREIINTGLRILSEQHAERPPVGLAIKEGTRIMLTENIDVSSGLCNGALCVVLGPGEPDPKRMRFDKDAAEEDTIRVRLCRNDTEHTIGPMSGGFEFEADDTKHRMTWTYYPLIYGWGITYHKLQGQTLYEGVVLTVSDRLGANMLYTGFTRATSLDKVYIIRDRTSKTNLSPAACLPKCIVVHPSSRRFQEMIADAAGAVERDERTFDELRPELRPEPRTTDTSAIPEDFLCKICYDSVASVVNIPCRHLVTCTACADKLYARDTKTCPVCRSFVTNSVKIVGI
jgi:hypothetical protein